MDTLSFLQRILPQSGVKVLAEPGDKPGVFRHFKFDTIEKTAAAAVHLNSKGVNIFHACSGFINKIDGKGMRTQDNAGWQKAFWLDLDVKPGKEKSYQDVRTALGDVLKLADQLKLPKPLIVSSGGGLHVYWTLTEEITTAEWRPVAEQFKQVVGDRGVMQDRSRTSDQASILRPVGVLNRKYDPAREVKVLNEGSDMAFEDFKAAIGYAEKPAVASRFAMSNALATPGEHIPSSAERIIQFCPTLKYVADKRGDVTEPLWHKMIGVVKHTVEGDLQAHKWSVGYSGYSELETQTKIDSWAAGPTTCAVFRDTDDNKCDGCEMKCKSPIQLGYEEEQEPPMAAVTQPPPVAPVGPMTPAQRMKAAWPKSFVVNSGVMYRMVLDKATGSVTPVAFCDTLFLPINRIRNTEGTWELEILMTERNGRQRKFNIAAGNVSAPDKLSVALGEHEVWVYGRQGKEHAMTYLREYAVNLQQLDTSTRTFEQFGWTDEGSFILGNREIDKKDEREILLSDDVKAGNMGDFGVAGTREAWIDAVNEVYNRPGAEACQFAFLVSAASPLVPLVEFNGFHGIPVAYCGASGQGKSTLTQMATGIWGNPNKFFHAAGAAGSTMNSLIKRVSVTRHLPWVFDELSDQDPKEMVGFLYALSNGKAKDRLNSSGNFASGGKTWDLNTFINGNQDLLESLFQVDKMKGDATSVRVFQVWLEDGYTRRVFGDTPVRDIVSNVLQHNYGVVGREILRYYMDNADKVRDMANRLRAKYTPNTNDETKERFYTDLIVVALTAGAVMRKLGLIEFDLDKICTWALENVKALRAQRQEKYFSDEDIVSGFLSSLHGRVIVTKNISGNTNRGYVEEIPNPPRESPLARVLTESKRVVVAAKAMSDWAKENNMTPSFLRDVLDKHGYIVHVAGRHKAGYYLARIGQGTNIATGPARCYELDYAKVYGLIADETQPMASITPITKDIELLNKAAGGAL